MGTDVAAATVPREHWSASRNATQRNAASATRSRSRQQVMWWRATMSRQTLMATRPRILVAPRLSQHRHAYSVQAPSGSTVSSNCPQAAGARGQSAIAQSGRWEAASRRRPLLAGSVRSRTTASWRHHGRSKDSPSDRSGATRLIGKVWIRPAVAGGKQSSPDRRTGAHAGVTIEVGQALMRPVARPNAGSTLG